MDGLLMRDDGPERTKGRRGVALVLSALFCLAFIPVVGLAIDGSISYLMRLKVSTALDAAVVAGARSLNIGATPSAEAASAIAVATRIFYADLPTTQNWGVTIVSFTPLSPLSATHIRTVTARAIVTIPLTFLSVLGVKTTQISVTASAQRRDLNVVLVLDHSGSMSGVIGSMDTDAASFVNSFAAGRDNVGLVTFAGSSYVAYTPKTTFQTDSPNLSSLIGGITTYNGGTNTAAAVWAAYQQLVTLNEPGALNVIVVFTDGLANNFTANFTGLVAPAAGCNSLINPLTGVIGSNTGETVVFGLFDPTAQSLNDPTELRAAPNTNGCANI